MRFFPKLTLCSIATFALTAQALFAASDNLTPLHSFSLANTNSFTNPDGGVPEGGLALSGGTLFGSTSTYGPFESGTLFSVGVNGSGFKTIHAFSSITNGGTNSDGSFCNSPLLVSGNTLYGTAMLGGTNGAGVIFSVGTDGNNFTMLYTFTGQFDGEEPSGSLVLTNNVLYGTAGFGGFYSEGSVWSFNLNNNTFATLYSFQAGNDGSDPYSGVILVGDQLYGTCFSAGQFGGGTVFTLGTNGSGFSTLHQFTALTGGGAGAPQTNSDGAEAEGLVAIGNTLYGTTSLGGANGYGLIYSLTTGGAFAPLHVFSTLTINVTGHTPVFSNPDGGEPRAALADSGNTLFGTATLGGKAGFGTVFSLDASGSSFTVLNNFSNYPADGFYPSAPLIAANNTLYGQCAGGGISGSGVIFSVTQGPPAPTVPQFQLQPPASQTVGLGSSLIIDSLATANVKVSYQWYEAGQKVAGATAATLDIKSAAANSGGTYYVVASDSAGSTTSSVDFVTVKVLPVITTQPPKSVTTELGANVSLAAKASGPSLTYQWYEDGLAIAANNVSGVNSNELTFHTVNTGDPGFYTLVVSNPNGSVTSSVVQVQLKAETSKPSVTIASPKANARTTSAAINGTASDSVAVAGVNYWITNFSFSAPVVSQGAATVTAGKTASNWMVNVPLYPGSNILGVQSYNYAGLMSPVLYSKFFYEVSNPFTLGYVTSSGTIAGKAVVAGGPPPTNGANLFIGDPYQLTEKPLKGWVFANWILNYGYTTLTNTNSSIIFLMESNLVVTANFNPAPAPVVHEPPGSIIVVPPTSSPPYTGGNGNNNGGYGGEE